MNLEFTVIEENESGIVIKAEINGEIYYTINYVLDLMQAYRNYTFDNKSGNISFVLFDNGTAILENIPYVVYKSLIFISNAYYENTVLPKITK